MSDLTEIDGAETELDEKPKGKKGRKAGGKNTKKTLFTPAEVMEKLHLLFFGLAKVTGKEYSYKAKDYEQEANAVIRMNDKFPFVATFLTLLDPVLLIVGLFNKFAGMRSKKQPEQPKQPPENVVEMNGGGVNAKTNFTAIR